jgi:hypothetical protein
LLTLDSRTLAIQRQIQDFGVWTNTTIRAWGIFNVDALPLFVEGEMFQEGQLELALGAVASRIDEIVRESATYGLLVNIATLQLANRDKLHYFRLGNGGLLVITQFNIRGEEEFLQNITQYISRLQELLD